MNESKDNSDQQLDGAFQQISDLIHPPVEVLWQYAQSALNTHSQSKILTHVDNCQQCKAIVAAASKFLREEANDSVDETPELRDQLSMSTRLRLKRDLVTRVLTKKDGLVEGVAKSLLPQDAWFVIKPITAMSRSNKSRASSDPSKESPPISAAAFSSDSSHVQIEWYRIVDASMMLINTVCDLLIERCDQIQDLRETLVVCTHQVMSLSDTRRIASMINEQDIYKVLSRVLIGPQNTEDASPAD